MTPGGAARDPLVPHASTDRRGVRRSRPIAALAEMIQTVLTASPAASAEVLNRAHRLGESAAEGLLDAGDVRGWELCTGVAAELCALARTGWLPAGPDVPPVRTQAT